MTGADIRRYRRAIGWKQTQFAAKIGLSQGALSMLEAGRIGVSEDHIAQLKKLFDGANLKPRFSDFLSQVQLERAQEQAAVSSPGGRYLTLTAWLWQEGLDLGKPMPRDQAGGLVTVETHGFEAIAFRMTTSTSAWQKGEIIVFERCEQREIRNGELCLVHLKPPRSRTPRTLIATAKIDPPDAWSKLILTALSPASGRVHPDSQITAFFREIYRGRQAT